MVMVLDLDKGAIDFERTMLQVRREVAMEALRVAKGSKALAARLLGIKRTTFVVWLIRAGLMPTSKSKIANSLRGAA